MMPANNITASYFATALQDNGGRLLIPTVAAAVLGIAVIIAFHSVDPLSDAEPPLLNSKVPFIGHLLGMLRWQVGYFQMLSSKVPLYPAFTLRIFSKRIYVICDPALIQAAYRNTKAFDFGSFVVASSQPAFDIGEHGMKIIRGETAPGYDPKGAFLNGNNGDSYLNENHKIMVEYLTPGPALMDLNKGILNRVAGFLDGVEASGKKVGFYEWIRDVLTIATAESLYGPESPLNSNPQLVDSLWDFEENMTLLMLSLLPTIIAPKAYKGRAAIKEAFTSFYANNHNITASKLVQARLACAQKWGFTPEDIANFEISTLFLATTNTVPTTFWHLSYILSSPPLFQKIRIEAEKLISRKTTESGIEEAVLDTTLFQEQCPLLLSTFQETLRSIDAATSVRAVVLPTTLSNPSKNISFDLKSPAVIQLPSGITHNSTDIWGEDAQHFNAERFLPSTKATLPKVTRRAQQQGYFPFGGGKHLCPGRHFALVEVLAFVAAIVAGFDVEGMDTVPEKRGQKLGTAVRKPLKDCNVHIKRREGWEQVKWRFDVLGKGEKGFGGMVGDIVEGDN